MNGGKAGANGAMNAESDILQQQYNQDQQQIQEKRNILDQTEIGMLRAQGGPQMVPPAPANNPITANASVVVK
jgi:hypothetical protein